MFYFSRLTSAMSLKSFFQYICIPEFKWIKHNELMKTAWIILFSLFSNLVLAAGLNIGVAAVRITPPMGTPMAGYYYVRGAEGVHDDLYAKTLVIDPAFINILGEYFFGFPQFKIQQHPNLQDNQKRPPGAR